MIYIVHSVSVFMDHFAAVNLLCLEQGNCSLQEHLEEFLDLAHLTTFLDERLCTFLHAALNTTT